MEDVRWGPRCSKRIAIAGVAATGRVSFRVGGPTSGGPTILITRVGAHDARTGSPWREWLAPRGVRHPPARRRGSPTCLVGGTRTLRSQGCRHGQAQGCDQADGAGDDHYRTDPDRRPGGAGPRPGAARGKAQDPGREEGPGSGHEPDGKENSQLSRRPRGSSGFHLRSPGVAGSATDRCWQRTPSARRAPTAGPWSKLARGRPARSRTRAS
jgi:hypothetical protein